MYDRMEKRIEKLEKNIEKNREKIKELETKCEEHEISEKKFHKKKTHLLEKIRVLDSQVRVLKGGLVKQKHHADKNA
jgi:uncharacterized coiled-coil protein SlyX